jgi:hypothetical protein
VKDGESVGTGGPEPQGGVADGDMIGRAELVAGAAAAIADTEAGRELALLRHRAINLRAELEQVEARIHELAAAGQ